MPLRPRGELLLLVHAVEPRGGQAPLAAASANSESPSTRAGSARARRRSACDGTPLALEERGDRGRPGRRVRRHLPSSRFEHAGSRSGTAPRRAAVRVSGGGTPAARLTSESRAASKSRRPPSPNRITQHRSVHCIGRGGSRPAATPRRARGRPARLGRRRRGPALPPSGAVAALEHVADLGGEVLARPVPCAWSVVAQRDTTTRLGSSASAGGRTTSRRRRRPRRRPRQRSIGRGRRDDRVERWPSHRGLQRPGDSSPRSSDRPAPWPARPPRRRSHAEEAWAEGRAGALVEMAPEDRLHRPGR